MPESNLPPHRRGAPLLRLGAVQWAVIVVGIAITATLSLGAHDLAIAHIGIPYPDEKSVPPAIRSLRYTVTIGGVVALCYAARASLKKRSLTAAAVLISLLLAAFFETLRAISIDWKINDGWHDSHWAFILTKHLPRAVGYFYQGFVGVTISRYIGRFRIGSILAATVIAGALGFLLVAPAFATLGQQARIMLGVTAPPDLFKSPYPLEVYVYIYGMFLEPATAAFVMAGIAWAGLPGNWSGKLWSFTAIVLCLRGDIVTTLIYSFWSSMALPLAFASEGQFLIESTLLGLLSGLTWLITLRSRKISG